MKASLKVLFITLDPDIQKVFENILFTLGYEIRSAGSSQEGLAIFHVFSPDIIIIDIESVDEKPENLIKILRQPGRPNEIIVISEAHNIDLLFEYSKYGATEYFFKPLNPDEIEIKLHNAAARLLKFQGLYSEKEKYKSLFNDSNEELTHLNIKLRKAYEDLDILHKMKSEFISFINHELRTPLTSLAAFKLLESEKISDKSMKIVKIISEGYARLEYLVKQALDYFRTITQIPETTISPFLLNSIIEEILKHHAKAIDDKKIKVTKELNFDVNIESDKELLTKVFDVLIGNAVKFNKAEGEIKISLDQNNEKISVKVSDTGIGLQNECLDNIFYAFSIQNINYHSRGSGLSLPIIKNLLYFLNADIYAESAGTNKGATFIVELPLRI